MNFKTYLNLLNKLNRVCNITTNKKVEIITSITRSNHLKKDHLNKEEEKTVVTMEVIMEVTTAEIMEVTIIDHHKVIKEVKILIKNSKKIDIFVSIKNQYSFI